MNWWNQDYICRNCWMECGAMLVFVMSVYFTPPHSMQHMHIYSHTHSLSFSTSHTCTHTPNREFNTEAKRLVKVLKRQQLQEVYDILGQWVSLPSIIVSVLSCAVNA